MCQSEKGDSKVSKKFPCRKCEGNIAEAEELEQKLCD